MEARAVDPELTGMTCAACAARIEKVLNRADGVEATVNSPPRLRMSYSMRRRRRRSR
jgi:copper chaperone CopZ